MPATHVRLKTAAAVSYADGRTEALTAGEVVEVSELAEHLQEGIRDGDPWLDNLFDTITGTARGRKPKAEKPAEVARIPDAETDDLNPVVEQAARRGRAKKEG